MKNGEITGRSGGIMGLVFAKMWILAVGYEAWGCGHQTNTKPKINQLFSNHQIMDGLLKPSSTKTQTSEG